MLQPPIVPVPMTTPPAVAVPTPPPPPHATPGGPAPPGDPSATPRKAAPEDAGPRAPGPGAHAVGGALATDIGNPTLDLARARILSRIGAAERHLRQHTTRADRAIAARHAGRPAPTPRKRH